MIESIPISPPTSFYQSVASGRGQPCVLGPVVPVGNTNWPYKSVVTGEDRTRAAVIHGNHIDDLPYWSSHEEWSNPPWQFEIIHLQNVGTTGNTCGFSRRTTRKGDGRSIGQVLRSDMKKHVFSSNEMDFVRRTAELKAKANLRKGLVNAPLLLAERAQTFKMISERVGDMMRVATSVQKRDFSKWKKLKSARSRKAFAQKAASSHLELIFGWLPLIDEIEGAVELLCEPKRLYVRGRGRMTKLSPILRSRRQGPAAMTRAYVTAIKAYSAYSVRTTLKADITAEFAREVQRLGFNPLYSLYDLTPLSFISGWFSNFNYYIQSLDPLVGAKFRTGSSSIRTVHHARAVTIGGVNRTSSNIYTCRGEGRSFAVSEFTERAVLSSEPESTFELYNNFSTYSVLAGISLYLQRRLKPLQVAIKMKPFRYKSKRPVNLPPIKYTRAL